MIEKEARKSLGGISSVESVIHITATGFRMAAIAIILALKPLEAYNLQYITNDLPPYQIYLQGLENVHHRLVYCTHSTSCSQHHFNNHMVVCNCNVVGVKL